jgi:hypothetical protein
LPAPEKLTDADVKQIRRRVRRGERITDLAAAYGVNRRTVRRRLRRQAAAERRKLQERERAPTPVEEPRPVRRREEIYSDWLGTKEELDRPRVRRRPGPRPAPEPGWEPLPMARAGGGRGAH